MIFSNASFTVEIEFELRNCFFRYTFYFQHKMCISPKTNFITNCGILGRNSGRFSRLWPWQLFDCWLRRNGIDDSSVWFWWQIVKASNISKVNHRLNCPVRPPIHVITGARPAGHQPIHPPLLPINQRMITVTTATNNTMSRPKTNVLPHQREPG
jgi:hypothetical protein